MPDILFILLLALIIFGPKRLPEIARQIGKLTQQFRHMSNDLRAQLQSEMLKIELEERQKKAALPEPASSPESQARLRASQPDAETALVPEETHEPASDRV